MAPIAVRVARIMKSEGLNQDDALNLIEDNDKAAAEYCKILQNQLGSSSDL